MAITAPVGKTFTFTASDLDATGAPDPNASNTWAEVDGAVDANGRSTGVLASSGFIGALAQNGLSATADAIAEGEAFVASQATDPDNPTGGVWSAPYAVTVTPALAATDTVTVEITASVA